MKKALLAALLIFATFRTAIPMEHPHTAPVAVQHDINCLAENIYYEGRGEPDAGQVAIADVTLNRTKADGFPATVCGVVHQKRSKSCQFSWVCWRDRPPVDRKSQEWEKAKEIATNVLLFKNGQDTMQKRSVLYYHATYVHPGWAKKMKFVKKIGGHMFYASNSST